MRRIELTVTVLVDDDADEAPIMALGQEIGAEYGNDEVDTLHEALRNVFIDPYAPGRLIETDGCAGWEVV